MVDDDDITETNERTSLIGMNTTAIDVEVDYVEFNYKSFINCIISSIINEL